MLYLLRYLRSAPLRADENLISNGSAKIGDYRNVVIAESTDQSLFEENSKPDFLVRKYLNQSSPFVNLKCKMF